MIKISRGVSCHLCILIHGRILEKCGSLEDRLLWSRLWDGGHLMFLHKWPLSLVKLILPLLNRYWEISDFTHLWFLSVFQFHATFLLALILEWIYQDKLKECHLFVMLLQTVGQLPQFYLYFPLIPVLWISTAKMKMSQKRWNRHGRSFWCSSTLIACKLSQIQTFKVSV